MERAAADRAARQGHVDRLRAQTLPELRVAEDAAPLANRAFDRGSNAVGDRPDRRPVVGRQCADPAQDAGQAALLAEDLDLEDIDRRHLRRSLDRRARFGGERLQVVGELGQIHGSDRWYGLRRAPNQ